MRKVVKVVHVECWNNGPVIRNIFIYRNGHKCVGHLNESLLNKIRDNLACDLPDIPAFQNKGGVALELNVALLTSAAVMAWMFPAISFQSSKKIDDAAKL